MLDVLVVDDIEASRQALAESVAALGCRVRQAADGHAALEMIARQAPDLVLLDLLMPGLDGFEVTRRIRAAEQGEGWMPIIVCSSMPSEEHFDLALRQGADDFVVRPISPRFLAAKLSHYAGLLSLQQELRTAVQRQRDIHDHISEPVITLDDEGRLVDANMAACLRFGDGAPSGLLGGQVEAALGVSLERLLQSRELQLQDAQGQHFPAEVRCSEWLEHGSRRYTMVLRDLSEQRALERLKDEFLATVSHELRTPLTSIHGAVTLLEAGKAGELPPKARHLVDMAARNARRLSRLIDDVFDLTQLESRRMAVNCREQAIGTALQEALSTNQGVTLDKGLSLVSDWQAADLDTPVNFDADRFAQVLANLISNAAKHSPPQGRIELALSVDARRVRISVRDQGPGIPAGFRARMFDKFSRASGGDARDDAGLGLGLYVSRLLVERMGGRISLGPARSGCDICIDLPRLGHGLQALVWLVDADPGSAERTRRWLGASWKVLHLSHPSQLDEGAMRELRDPPDLILADPQGQGHADAFLDALRRKAPFQPLLLFSDTVDRSYAELQGASFLKKEGCDATELVRTLRRLLHHD